MTRLKKFITVVLSIALLLSSAAIEFSLNVSAATTKVAYINGAGVNVRKTASTSGTKVDTISYREVTVTGTSGSWLKVTYTSGGKKVSGYIYNDSKYVYVTSYNPDASFTAQLENFPDSYHSALTTLHKKYPNWKFIPDYVNTTFDKAVALQMSDMRKQVEKSQSISWRSMGKGSYDWSTGKWSFSNGGWTGASREVISYYMDPRNFFNADEIYMFLKQGYNYGSYTEEGLEKVVAGTFLKNGYSDPDNKEGYKGSYIKIIMEAGKQSGVSPYIIASAIIQEQGSKGTSDLISGNYNSTYKDYYNFFNYGASGDTTAEVIKNGLAYAKQKRWNSRSAAIIGGAKEFIKGYIEIGQDTYYYQDFNVHFPGNDTPENKGALWHQYAQAVHDARSKGYSLNKIYASDTDSQLTFRIPVYSSMPLKASPKPEENSKHNNYYFNNISVSGLAPSFSRYTYSYTLSVSDDTVIDVNYPSTASLACDKEFALKKGTNNIVLKVKSQTGYTTDYEISVNATKACTLYINTSGASDKEDSDENVDSTTVIKGDVNGDSKITASDMANIRLHILGKYILKGDNLTAADINKDGDVTASDMANVRLHLLGKYTIK